jgi:hypothetical protein
MLAITSTKLIPEFNKEQEVAKRFNKYLPKPKNMRHKA